MLEEIIKSCQNPAVAEAAVRSIGYPFRGDVEAAAERHDASPGVFVAAVVRCFASQATPRARSALLAAMRRTDQPVLVGLRTMLAHVIVGDRDEDMRRACPDVARKPETRAMHCCA